MAEPGRKDGALPSGDGKTGGALCRDAPVESGKGELTLPGIDARQPGKVLGMSHGEPNASEKEDRRAME